MKWEIKNKSILDYPIDYESLVNADPVEKVHFAWLPTKVWGIKSIIKKSKEDRPIWIWLENYTSFSFYYFFNGPFEYKKQCYL